jgi:hypothetical protein
MTISQARLHELLRYDPRTGWFTWRVQLNGRVPAGTRAGTIKKRGNREIKIDGRLYQSGRLAFLYVMGFWPDPEIDHRNGDATDDRWSNLREATRTGNMRNRGRFKTKDTPKGVSWHRGIGQYTARITVNYQTIALGTFDTAEEAAAAYADAAEKYFGKFARTDD